MSCALRFWYCCYNVQQYSCVATVGKMFLLEASWVWNLVFILNAGYGLLVFSVFCFSLPVLVSRVITSQVSQPVTWVFIPQMACTVLISLIFVLLMGQVGGWTHYALILWFGHLAFTSFQAHIILIFAVFGFISAWSVTSTWTNTTRESFDLGMVVVHLLFWEVLLFAANSLLTVLLLIELLTTAVFVVLVSSSFSSFSFYSTLDFHRARSFTTGGPAGFLRSLLSLFWMSLVISLNLFLFLILFVLHFGTTDWFVIEYVFMYFVQTYEMPWPTHITLVWWNLLISVFLKCGLVPFYFWKPVFFKNLPIFTLFIYIVLFYFFLILFLISFFVATLGELFLFFSLCNVLLLAAGLFSVILLLLDSYMIKTFLAMSSILNTLLVFLVMSSVTGGVSL